MKTLKFFITICLILAFANTNVLKGQTVQIYPVATLENSEAWCIGKELSGYLIYHLTYHIDKKTGFVDRVHANIHKAEVYDSEDPTKKYLLFDTGNDNSGISWSFWNETTLGGTNTFVYDQESYDLPIGILPPKGGNVWASFKFISKGGEKFTVHQVMRFTLNPDGTLNQVSNHENIDCAVW